MVAMCSEAGLGAIAITDHDTISAFAVAQQAGDRVGLSVVPGIECSGLHLGKEVHILGYFVDPTSSTISAYQDSCRKYRRERAERIVARLRRLGAGIDISDAAPESEDTTIGRFHIATALVNRGVVDSYEAAFATYLGDGMPAFIPAAQNTVRDIIEMIHASGGLAVVAHPGHRVGGFMLRSLVAAGLDGIEVYHPSHDSMLVTYYESAARRYGLTATGGSDYHGRRPEAAGVGSYGLTEEAFEKLKTLALSSRRRVIA
jgi:predicted metal-dependent phosphoesterase TrpH